MTLQGKLVFGLLVVLSAFFVIAGLKDAAQAGSFDAQVSRMHAMGVAHHAYEPFQQWKHDERVMVNQAASKRNEAYFNLGGATLCAFGALFVLVKGRGLVSLVRYVAQREIVVPMTPPPTPIVPTSTRAERSHAEELGDALAAQKRRSAKLGDEGEDQVAAVFREMEADGWTFQGGHGKIKVMRRNGTQKGDLDFFVRAPNGICFAVDAKNWNRIITYSSKRNVLIGTDEINSRDKIEHNLSETVGLAKYAERTFGVSNVVPVVCFTEITDVRVMPVVDGVQIVRIDSLRSRLEEVAGVAGKVTHGAVPISVRVMVKRPGDAVLEASIPNDSDEGYGAIRALIGDRCDVRTVSAKRLSPNSTRYVNMFVDDAGLLKNLDRNFPYGNGGDWICGPAVFTASVDTLDESGDSTSRYVDIDPDDVAFIDSFVGRV